MVTIHVIAAEVQHRIHPHQRVVTMTMIIIPAMGRGLLADEGIAIRRLPSATYSRARRFTNFLVKDRV